MKKNIILTGAPGSGKGTLATRLKDELHLVHISTGDMFREAIANQTELGKIAKSIIDKGDLVPDDITIALVKERLSKKDCENGFLLDGFPRTIAQAEALDNMSKEINREIDVVINLDCSDNELIRRVTGRRVCPQCGAPYHIAFAKPKVDGKCDKCGSALIQRKDDNEESFKVRLNHYNLQTKPLIDYYQKKNLVKSFSSNKSKELVFDEVKAFLEK